MTKKFHGVFRSLDKNAGIKIQIGHDRLNVNDRKSTTTNTTSIVVVVVVTVAAAEVI
jgi:hypothetical protein